VTQVGSLVDSLGVEIRTLDDGDMVTDVLLIAKVVDAEGSVRLALAWSDGMSWIERLGMITAAQGIEMPTSSDDDGA